MDDYKQLELFDLQAYTSKQPSVTDVSKVTQVRVKHQNAEFEQLELNLFPEKAHRESSEVLRQAA
jgi:hypothetical protein